MESDDDIQYFCDKVCGYWYGEDCTLTTCPVRDYIRWKRTQYDKHTCQECANLKGNYCVYTDETGKQTCCVKDRKEACTYFRPI